MGEMKENESKRNNLKEGNPEFNTVKGGKPKASKLLPILCICKLRSLDIAEQRQNQEHFWEGAHVFIGEDK